MPKVGRARRQITLRLDPNLYSEIAEEAGSRKVPVIDYLRFCVERGHQVEAVARQVGELRYLAQQIAGGGSAAPVSGSAAPGLPEIRQVVKAELDQLRKAVSSSSSGQDGSRVPHGMPELLTSAFVVEELLRESMAARNPTSIRGAQERARSRAAEVLGKVQR